MKTIFLTGISGLLGTNIAHQLLKQGFLVKGLVRNKLAYKGISHPNLILIEGDLYSDMYLLMQDASVVIHAAAETRQDLLKYSDYAKINYSSTVLLYLAAVQRNVSKFIFISTANTLGYGTESDPGNESYPMKSPFDKSLYAQSKYEAENYLLKSKHKTEVIIINPTFMLGSFDSKPSSGKIVLMGWKKTIVFYPPGGKNFVHVEDVALAVMKCIHSKVSKSQYIISGENISFGDFFKKISKLTQQKTLLIKIPKCIMLIFGHLGDIFRFWGIKCGLSSTNMRILCTQNYYSNEKSKKELGINYQSIDKAILDAIEYFKMQKLIKNN